MKKVLAVIMLMGLVFAGGMTSEVNYFVSKNTSITINNQYEAQYFFQTTAPMYVSMTGVSPNLAWLVNTGNFSIDDSFVPAGYNIRIYATNTANVIVGKFGK